MSTYSYLKDTDFGGNFNSDQFKYEINNDVTIVTSLSYINRNGNNIDIVFDSALSAPEITALTTLKDNYVYKENPKSQNDVTNASFDSSTTFNFSSTGNRTITLPDTTDTLVAQILSQTLQNKKLVTSNTEVVDGVDNTKKIKFDSSVATTGTELTIKGIQTGNRTITFPDNTDTLACISSSQTLSNKDLVDSSVVFIDNVDNTKKLDFSLSGASTNSTLTLTSNHSAHRTITLPNATTTLIGANTTDTLTNKTISASNNTISNLAIADITDLTSASTTVSGLIELATQSEVDTASNNTLAITPLTLGKGQASGVATLDGGGKVPASQLALSNVVYTGTWNANTNTPTLADGVGTQGNYYVVSVSGSTNIDGITDWVVGDWIIFNGTVWEKSDHTDTVTSVAGKQGVVTLQLADITDLANTGDLPEGSNLYYTEARVNANSSVAANTAKVSADGSVTTHSDVVVTAVTDNEVLAYDNGTSKWINQTPAEAGLAAVSHTHSATDITSGTLNNARVAESNVTQHVGALVHQSLSGAGTNTHTQIDTHISSTSNPHTVTKAQVGLTNVQDLKVKLDATTAPTTTDDSGSGYAVGSTWIDITANKSYICVDATVSSAIWNDLTASGGGGEANTSSSVGGTSLVKTKVGVDLPFKGLTATSTKIALTSNTNDIGIDVTEANLTLQNLGGTLSVAKGGCGTTTHTFGNFLLGAGTSAVTSAKAAPTGVVLGTSDTQTLTNKTIIAATNTVRASELATTGASIVITGGAPPTTGQVLTAQTATTANWQTPSGGSLTSYQASSVTTTSTTSASDVLLSDMTITPISGTYLIVFSTAVENSASNGLSYYSLYIGESRKAHTERLADGSKHQAISLNSIETVNGSQAIEIRYKKSGNNTATAYERTLSIVKI